MDSYKNFVTFTDRQDHPAAAQERGRTAPVRTSKSEMDRAIETYEKKYKIEALRARSRWRSIPIMRTSPSARWACRDSARWASPSATVVAMDSPSGRPPGIFHWASTLWHELSHVYTLDGSPATGVPRWFTEGMAVHEETAASPEWGDRIDPASASTAIKEKKLLPMAELDRGFIRPHLSGAGGGLLFPGGQDLRLHQRAVGLRQAARDDGTISASSKSTPR